ncbi:response regulator transcription factor [Shewanella sp. KCT]|uniref:response regulator transcription factor n=1 Tax=Shewanella sp. KCT TaxID=2569535 RepID=UPI001182D216|nr:response regulator transcription factor [Shewanella sp. KCT]TVP16291.1 DNA-binding response regulator [Shewanella sp. KCT]
MERVLLVDDDPFAREVLYLGLVDSGYQVHCASNGQEALLILGKMAIDLIILDIEMPLVDGFAFLESRSDNLPVILISATDEEERRVKGFRLGADDFLSKPVSVRELVVRIEALRRRAAITKAQLTDVLPLPIKAIYFNQNDFSIEVAERRVSLTQTEFKLLKYLFDRKGEVITKQELQKSVLKKDLGQFDRNLDMHISNTRRKLAKICLPKTIINTVRGQGYSFLC